MANTFFVDYGRWIALGIGLVATLITSLLLRNGQILPSKKPKLEIEK